MEETRIPSLGWENLLEKEMATHSSILAWETPWTEEPGGLPSMGSQRVGYNLATNAEAHVKKESFNGILANLGGFAFLTTLV